MYINIYILYIHMTIENISQRILSLGPCAIQGIWSRHLCSRRAYDWHCKTCAQRSFSCALSAGALRHTAERWVYIHVYIYIYIYDIHIYIHMHIYLCAWVFCGTLLKGGCIYIYDLHICIYICACLCSRALSAHALRRVYVCIYAYMRYICVCVCVFPHNLCMHSAAHCWKMYTHFYIYDTYVFLCIPAHLTQGLHSAYMYICIQDTYIYVCMCVCVLSHELAAICVSFKDLFNESLLRVSSLSWSSCIESF